VLTVPTLLLSIFGTLPGVLDFYSNIKIAVVDWTSAGASIRPTGLGIYFTEGALILSLSAIMTLIHLPRSPLRRTAVEITTGVLLIVMASRTILIAHAAAWALALGLRNRSVTDVLIVAGLFLGALACVAAALGGFEMLPLFFADEIVASRQGSTDVRLQSYSMAYDLVVQQNPLFGLGIKPFDESLLEVPIGSHSTLASTFTKGGFVSLAVFAAFYFAIIAIWISFVLRSRRISILFPESVWKRVLLLLRAAVVVLCWMVTEDIDAAANATVLGFLSIGLGLGALDTVFSLSQTRHRST
jgi:hypothetical protein